EHSGEPARPGFGALPQPADRSGETGALPRRPDPSGEFNGLSRRSDQTPGFPQRAEQGGDAIPGLPRRPEQGGDAGVPRSPDQPAEAGGLPRRPERAGDSAADAAGLSRGAASVGFGAAGRPGSLPQRSDQPADS